MERRSFAGEVRSQDIDGAKYLVGYAAKFGVQSRDLGGFREVVDKRAFDRALSEKQPVACVVAHDPLKVLGTTKSGSLSLQTDDQGLSFRCLLPDTTYARDVVALTSRGDAAEASFAFKATPTGDKWGTVDGVRLRQLVDVNLFDVSVGCIYPAYPDTEVALRSMTMWEEAQKPKVSAIDLVERRQRLRERELRDYSAEAKAACADAKNASKKADDATKGVNSGPARDSNDEALKNATTENHHAAADAHLRTAEMHDKLGQKDAADAHRDAAAAHIKAAKLKAIR